MTLAAVTLAGHAEVVGVTKLQLLFTLFVLTQLADGILTYVGLSRGLSEGNPVALWGFARFGVVPTLIVMKIVGVVCGYVLYATGSSGMLSALTILMITIVVIPWILAILFLT